MAVSSADARAGVLAHWALDEGAGQVAGDDSGHGHSGQLGSTGGADGNDPGWVPGHTGSALRFDGTRDQYVLLTGARALAPQRLTAIAWIRRAGTPGAYRYVVSNGAQSCEQSSFGLYSGANAGLAFYVSDANGYVVSPAVGAGAVWDGAWHEAAGTYDGHSVRLYLDGVEVGAGTPASFAIDYSAAAAAYIGTFRGACDLPFTGDIDDVAIYDSALDVTAVRSTLTPERAAPVLPQISPIGAGPLPGSSGGAGGSPAAGPADTTPPACVGVSADHRTVKVRRRTRIAVTVRDGRRALRGRKVTVSGGGAKPVSARTAKTGRAVLSVRPIRRGTLRVAVSGQARGCRAWAIAVR